MLDCVIRDRSRKSGFNLLQVMQEQHSARHSGLMHRNIQHLHAPFTWIMHSLVLLLVMTRLSSFYIGQNFHIGVPKILLMKSLICWYKTRSLAGSNIAWSLDREHWEHVQFWHHHFMHLCRSGSTRSRIAKTSGRWPLLFLRKRLLIGLKMPV